MKQFQTEVKISVKAYQFYQVFINRYYERVQFFNYKFFTVSGSCSQVFELRIKMHISHFI